MTPVSFYNQYRTVICNNLAKTNDIIKYRNDERMTRDEAMSPMLEDLVLLNVAIKGLVMNASAQIFPWLEHTLLLDESSDNFV